MKRVYSNIPRPAPGAHGPGRPIPALGGLGTLLAHGAYAGLAWLRGGPGIAMRARSARLGWRAKRRDRRIGRDLLVSPMDSTRYFELEFAWRAACACGPAARYLDISSPRLLPVALVATGRIPSVRMINPDPVDAAATRRLAQVLGVEGSVEVLELTVAAADFPPAGFDLVTSVSVIEHIEGDGDVAAVERAWAWLRPGGRLVLTVPCAAEPFEEYFDIDPYGLASRDQTGFYFSQRFYDERMIRERVLSICGPPTRRGIIGERQPGTFVADRALKNLGTWKPAREPWAMASDWRPFASAADLPGLGVMALEFTKGP